MGIFYPTPHIIQVSYPHCVFTLQGFCGFPCLAVQQPILAILYLNLVLDSRLISFGLSITLCVYTVMQWLCFEFLSLSLNLLCPSCNRFEDHPVVPPIGRVLMSFEIFIHLGLNMYKKYCSIKCGIQLEIERLKYKTQPLTVPCCTH